MSVPLFLSLLPLLAFAPGPRNWFLSYFYRSNCSKNLIPVFLPIHKNGRNWISLEDVCPRGFMKSCTFQ